MRLLFLFTDPKETMLSRFDARSRFQMNKIFFVLALNLFASLQTMAGSACSKSDLERTLVGKIVVSSVQIGGKAVRAGCDRACELFSVDTLLFPDGQISYRSSWIYQVEPPVDSFPVGTTFTITKIAIKSPDWLNEPAGLELHLKDGAGKSADVRVLIGPALVSDCDLNGVEGVVSSFLESQEPPPARKPEQPQAQVSVGGDEYRQAAISASIPGRIPNDQLQSVLTALDQESERVGISVLAQAEPISSMLRSIYIKAIAYPDFRSNLLIQKIAELQKTLGKPMHPRSVDDIAAMTDLVNRCAKIFGTFVSEGWPDVISSANTRVVGEQNKQNRIRADRDAIVKIEMELDKGSLVSASSLYQALSSGRVVADFSPLQRYLQATATFRSDLAAYAAEEEISHSSRSSLSDRVGIISRQVQMLAGAQNKTIAMALIKKQLAEDDTDLKSAIDAVLPFQLDQSEFALPAELRKTTAANGDEKTLFLESRIALLDSRLTRNSEIVAIGAQPDSVSLMMSRLGDPTVGRCSEQGSARLPTLKSCGANLRRNSQILVPS